MPLAIWSAAASCSLVIGELPEGVDPAAGGASGMAGASSGGASGSGGTAGSGGSAGVGGTAGIAGTGGTGTCKNPPCDCDGDGAEKVGSGCKGDDCDDTDPEAKPGQTQFFDHPLNDGSGSFDFDCNGKQEFEHPDLLQCLPVGCTVDAEGWKTEIPSCGKAGVWAKCIAPTPPTCSVVDVSNQFMMKCR